MKKKGNNEQSVKVWGKFEDSKLRALFETVPSKGGIAPEDTTKNTLEKIIDTHFAGRNYHSFLQLFRKKSVEVFACKEVKRKKEGGTR